MKSNHIGIVAALAVGGVAYWLYKNKTAAPKSFANLATGGGNIGCPCQIVVRTFKDDKGNTWNVCKGGQACPATASFGGKAGFSGLKGLK